MGSAASNRPSPSPNRTTAVGVRSRILDAVIRTTALQGHSPGICIASMAHEGSDVGHRYWTTGGAWLDRRHCSALASLQRRTDTGRDSRMARTRMASTGGLRALRAMAGAALVIVLLPAGAHAARGVQETLPAFDIRESQPATDPSSAAEREASSLRRRLGSRALSSSTRTPGGLGRSRGSTAT